MTVFLVHAEMPVGRTVLARVVWILVCSSHCRLHADEPLPPPQMQEVRSPSKQFCAVLTPKSMTTVIYKMSENGSRKELWRMKGWFRVAHLADDGDHLVVGNDGINLLPLNVTKDEPMILFYRQGKLLSTVTLGDLLAKFSSLERTVSHYHWETILVSTRRGIMWWKPLMEKS